jgi:hypothetical protein
VARVSNSQIRWRLQGRLPSRIGVGWGQSLRRRLFCSAEARNRNAQFSGLVEVAGKTISNEDINLCSPLGEYSCIVCTQAIELTIGKIDTQRIFWLSICSGFKSRSTMSCLLFLHSAKCGQWHGNIASSGCRCKSPRRQLQATIIWIHISNSICSFVP